MSYHEEDRLLPVQMDIWTLNANGDRKVFCHGRTWFVDVNTPCELGDGSLSCGGFDILGPYNAVADGVNNAAPGDIVSLRGGNYRGAITITKQVTLKASHGNALVGTP